MNYNFHNDLNDKCQRLLNAMEPGTVMPIHHHKVDEVFIVLSGSLRVLTYDDNKNVVEDILLDYNSGNFGVQIPANTWHSVEIEEEGTVIFEVKEGPYIPHEVGGMLQ
jgi:cupin fold WbuC family metalloprotein